MKKIETDFTAKIATNLWQEVFEAQKIELSKIKLPSPVINRIFPGYVAPILRVAIEGKRIEPMIYSCHPPSYLPAKHVRKLASYNARRDSLSKRFWSEAVGIHHGIIVLRGFYEWVAVKDLLQAGAVTLKDVCREFQVQSDLRRKRWLDAGKSLSKLKPTKTEQQDPMLRGIVIEFCPRSGEQILAPVIFSRNYEDLTDVRGFAIVTDGPNQEVHAAGHDRMPINLRPNKVDDWLQAAGQPLSKIDQILHEQKPEYYGHRISSSVLGF